MRLAILALLATSCALPSLLGYDSQQRESLARTSHEAAETIKEAVVECAPNVVEEVTKAVEVIQENTVDQIDRARITQKLYNAKPQKLPELRSPADDIKVNALAGKAEDRETRRRIARELPKKAAAGVGWVVKEVVPAWIVWGIGIVVFFALGGGALLVWVWRKAVQARKGLQSMIVAGNKPEAKEHFRGKTNGPAQAEYRTMRDKGLL